MNSILKLASLFVLTFNISYANVTFQKVSKVGPMQHKVIYASPKYKIKRTNGVTKAFVKMIAMWGIHVYEVGLSEYTCSASNHCQFNQWISLAFYDSCVVKGKQASCRGKSSGGDNTPSDYSTKGYFETYEREFERESRDSQGNYDFPERGNEYWEYPSNLF